MGGCHSATLLRRAPLRALAGGSKPAVFFSDVGGTRVEGAALSHALGQQEDLGGLREAGCSGWAQHAVGPPGVRAHDNRGAAQVLFSALH